MRTLLVAALILGLSAVGVPRAAAGPTAPPPPVPPWLRIVSPRGVLTGSQGLTLGLLSTRGWTPNPNIPPSEPVAYWNDQPLNTRYLRDELYEADVPGSLLTTEETAMVTMRNNIGSSYVLTVVVSGTLPPLPEPPADVTLSASPGVLGDASLTNTLTVRLADRAGDPVTDASVIMASSAGEMSAPRQLPDANGELTATLHYWPPATEPVTPVVEITASVLSPALYASATFTLTGTFTRHGTWMPRLAQAWPPTQPRPHNQTPCAAAELSPWEPITVPADHAVDYYRISSGLGLYFPPNATFHLLEAPQVLTLRLYNITNDNCVPGPGEKPVLKTTLIDSALTSEPFTFNLGYVGSFCEYLLEVRNEGPLTQRTYTVSQDVFGVLFVPLACYGN